MSDIDRSVRKLLKELGLLQHLTDPTQHAMGWVYESELEGEVDGSNRMFRLLYPPEPGTLHVEFRGLGRYEGGADDGDYVNEGYGPYVFMNAAPRNDADQVDHPPRARYRRSRVSLAEVDIAVLVAMRRRRGEARRAVHPLPPRRLWVAEEGVPE